MDIETKEALDWATNRLTKLPSKNTQDQYLKICERLRKNLINSVLPGTAAKRKTRSVERSAFRYWAAKMIIEKCFIAPAYVKAIYKIVKYIGAIAKKAQLDYSKGKKIDNAEVKGTKRTSINGLVNWREDLIAVSSNSKYADEIRVIAICGCRPSELEKGILIYRDKNTITITIKGSKCSDIHDAGQEWRILTIDANHPLIGSIPSGKYQAKAHAIEDAISHFGKKIKHNKKNPLSAYSFRHAAASDFIESGLSRQDVAAALGHQSTETLQYYAIYRGGSGMLNLNSVSAASPVRHTPKINPYKTSLGLSI